MLGEERAMVATIDPVSILPEEAVDMMTEEVTIEAATEEATTEDMVVIEAATTEATAVIEEEEVTRTEVTIDPATIHLEEVMTEEATEVDTREEEDTTIGATTDPATTRREGITDQETGTRDPEDMAEMRTEVKMEAPSKTGQHLTLMAVHLNQELETVLLPDQPRGLLRNPLDPRRLLLIHLEELLPEKRFLRRRASRIQWRSLKKELTT